MGTCFLPFCCCFSDSKCKASGEKLVLFSMSLKFLDAMEVLLKTKFGLTLAQGFSRIDGKANTKARFKTINDFNNSEGFKVCWRLSFFTVPHQQRG